MTTDSVPDGVLSFPAASCTRARGQGHRKRGLIGGVRHVKAVYRVEGPDAVRVLFDRVYRTGGAVYRDPRIVAEGGGDVGDAVPGAVEHLDAVVARRTAGPFGHVYVAGGRIQRDPDGVVKGADVGDVVPGWTEYRDAVAALIHHVDVAGGGIHLYVGRAGEPAGDVIEVVPGRIEHGDAVAATVGHEQVAGTVEGHAGCPVEPVSDCGDAVPGPYRTR